MSKLVDRTGEKYGHLTALHRASDKIYSSGRKVAMWTCLCECGNEIDVCTNSLRTGATRSCGCWNDEQRKSSETKFKKHGESNTRLYECWHAMKRRCSDKNNKNYGGRGVMVCKEWAENYENFATWAKENGYNDDLTLDRIDPNKNYCPENCKWSTNIEQQRNKRNNRIIKFNGEAHTLSEWSDITGINRHTISTRIDRLNWTIKKALTT